MINLYLYDMEQLYDMEYQADMDTLFSLDSPFYTFLCAMGICGELSTFCFSLSATVQSATLSAAVQSATLEVTQCS